MLYTGGQCKLYSPVMCNQRILGCVSEWNVNNVTHGPGGHVPHYSGHVTGSSTVIAGDVECCSGYLFG